MTSTQNGTPEIWRAEAGGVLSGAGAPPIGMTRAGAMPGAVGRADRSTYRPYGALRFGLSLMVVLQHASWLLPEATHPFFHMMGFGIIAVMIFFIISGFVIAEANTTFYAGRPVAFIINRALRLVPPYLAAMVLAAVAQEFLYLRGALHLMDGDLIGSPLQWKVLLAGVMDIVPFFQPRMIGAQDVHFIPFAWSLRLEFTFYLYAFIAFTLMARFKAQRVAIGYGAFIVAWLLFVLFLARGAKPPLQLSVIPFFAVGMAIFSLWQFRSKLHLWHVILGLIGCAIAFPLYKQLDNPSVPLQFPILIALLAVMFLLTFKVVLSPRLKAWDKALGDLSYPLYINHFVVLLVMWDLLSDFNVWTYLGCVVISIVLSYFMLHLVEVPMKGIRDRVRGQKLVN